MTITECTRCGECCKTVPCIFAQVRFGVDDWKGKQCPEFKMENGIAYCEWIEREDWMKEAFVGTGCEKPIHAKTKNNMSFLDVIRKCASEKRFIAEFNRLNGSHLFENDSRPPIVKMIDEATGYKSVIDDKNSKDMQDFILFVYDAVWLRLPEEAFE